MSRIGNRELIIPENVEVQLNNKVITVKGPKGELTLSIPEDVIVTITENKITVVKAKDKDRFKAIHGTINALINNMVIGVTEGYQKGLEIVGVGYRFQLKDKILVINAGYSHSVEVKIPIELQVESISNNEIVVKGIDKKLVGEFAANIRKVRKPEPYKGKGIRYKGEKIRRKEGKKAA